MLACWIERLARSMGIIGGVVLTSLALLMSLSITGGAIAKLANSEFLTSTAPLLASWLQDSGVRTIKGSYEIMEFGIAFVVFAFLPVTQFYRGHAVVDFMVTRFSGHSSGQINRYLALFWESIFFLVLCLITWRLFEGMLRLQQSGVIYQDLKIPQWYGYAVGFSQLCLCCCVSLYLFGSGWLTELSRRPLSSDKPSSEKHESF